jgi:predicted O-methyltransferase YrrM
MKRFVRWSFPVLERLGLHLTQRDPQDPVPDIGSLPLITWSRRSALVGIDLRIPTQLELLEHLRGRYRHEYDAFPRHPQGAPWMYHVDNGSFESVDGEILYCFIREFRPRRIMEIGSGYSTFLAGQAIGRNRAEDAAYSCDLVAIEPAPNAVLRRGFPGLTRLVESRVQDVPLEEFEALRGNDILFIDSSHVLKIGSDVQYLFLEVLPRLCPGVLVHVHDVFLPANYPREWVVRERRFYTEQYLLHAFLLFNRQWEVVWSASYLHLNHPEALEAAFETYTRHTRWPGSFWIRRVAESAGGPSA